LRALDDWTRVYSYSEGDHKSMHVLATGEGCKAEDEILFYRVDLKQPLPVKPGPRPAVEIAGGAVMSYEECASWLVELSYRLTANLEQSKGSVQLMRPRALKQKQTRVGWVGPEAINGLRMQLRLNALGQVFGAEIVSVAPRSFKHVASRLAAALPLDTVVICSGFATYIGVDAVPSSVRRDLIHLCDSKSPAHLEANFVTWLEIAHAEIEKDQQNPSADDDEKLLGIMLKGMLSHSKIGQFNHCQKATVLTGVRARHLNVATAERILNAHSELFQDSESRELFLWKDHHDGTQYFLNPRRIEDIKAMVEVRTNR
jgi:hypothetical protein